ncbi:MAG: Phospho-2-dehydro-3-deoxyheptonate aldolase, Tyr-sensitive [Chlamydiia bacterium]|nr:Phospho-2-dehydro-3-deoxyheptonate aldolase, Tyr-sensitive [Chlamydiia bacterium]
MTQNTLPSPHEIKAQFPLEPTSRVVISRFREKAKKRLICPISNQLYVFVGPCSIHEEKETLEYAERLKELSKQLTSLTPVMRAYIEKPRTVVGYKGALYQPDIKQKENLKEGLVFTRALFTKLANMHIPIATEFVDPYLTPYFDDIISWGFIGARTSSSQIHRQIASSMDFPIGFKNTIDGNTGVAIDAMSAASRPHAFFHITDSGKLCEKASNGNPSTHLVLRGSINSSNYSKNSLLSAYDAQGSLQAPILIDCSHGNSKKDIKKQREVFLEVAEYSTEKVPLLGMMMESYLEKGSQSPNDPLYNPRVSITDPCLDFETTQDLLKYADKILSYTKSSI